MKKVYLVDSENVGDIWVPLLVSSQPEDEVFVFYTQKSPHMNYENVRILKETEKEAVFIKCFEGSNALDFQLVSELGYRLHADEDCAYVIVSNDMGFDAVVRYWSAKDRPVSRLSGKECHRKLQEKRKLDAQGRKEPVWEDVSAYEQEQETRDVQSDPVLNVQAEEPAAQGGEEASGNAGDVSAGQDADAVCGRVQDGSAMEPVEEESAEPSDGLPRDRAEVIEALCSCISKENLVDFHNALVAFLGEDEGKDLYQEIKGKAEYTVYWSSLPKNSQKEKFEIYCRLVFAYSEPKLEQPEDFADFLHRAGGKRKNLNSLRAALLSHYGKDKGLKYYSLFKSHIKIMNRM